MPKRGELEAVAFRPTPRSSTRITWIGKVTEPKPVKKKTTLVEEGDWRSGQKRTGDATACRTMARCPRRCPSLTLGSLTVETPVVLAPMAGITNAAYRRLCAEQGAGLYVCEMITSRGLVERDETTLSMLVFDDLERSGRSSSTAPTRSTSARPPRSSAPSTAWRTSTSTSAARCPKVTRKGGGGALPWKRGLLGEILTAAVGAATPYDVPVTMKTRKGIDEDHLTYLDAGRIAQDSGCAAIALHGRTVAQSYSGEADWSAIARAGRARRHPGARQRRHLGGSRRAPDGRPDRRAGVVVGRGCLGRPWLFRDLAAAFAGGPTPPVLPTLGEVVT